MNIKSQYTNLENIIGDDSLCSINETDILQTRNFLHRNVTWDNVADSIDNFTASLLELSRTCEADSGDIIQDINTTLSYLSKFLIMLQRYRQRQQKMGSVKLDCNDEKVRLKFQEFFDSRQTLMQNLLECITDTPGANGTKPVELLSQILNKLMNGTGDTSPTECNLLEDLRRLSYRAAYNLIPTDRQPTGVNAYAFKQIFGDSLTQTVCTFTLSTTQFLNKQFLQIIPHNHTKLRELFDENAVLFLTQALIEKMGVTMVKTMRESRAVLNDGAIPGLLVYHFISSGDDDTLSALFGNNYVVYDCLQYMKKRAGNHTIDNHTQPGELEHSDTSHARAHYCHDIFKQVFSEDTPIEVLNTLKQIDLLDGVIDSLRNLCQSYNNMLTTDVSDVTGLISCAESLRTQVSLSELKEQLLQQISLRNDIGSRRRYSVLSDALLTNELLRGNMQVSDLQGALNQLNKLAQRVRNSGSYTWRDFFDFASVYYVERELLSQVFSQLQQLENDPLSNDADFRTVATVFVQALLKQLENDIKIFETAKAIQCDYCPRMFSNMRQDVTTLIGHTESDINRVLEKAIYQDIARDMLHSNSISECRVTTINQSLEHGDIPDCFMDIVLAASLNGSPHDLDEKLMHVLAKHMYKEIKMRKTAEQKLTFLRDMYALFKKRPKDSLIGALEAVGDVRQILWGVLSDPHLYAFSDSAWDFVGEFLDTEGACFANPNKQDTPKYCCWCYMGNQLFFVNNIKSQDECREEMFDECVEECRNDEECLDDDGNFDTWLAEDACEEYLSHSNDDCYVGVQGDTYIYE